MGRYNACATRPDTLNPSIRMYPSNMHERWSVLGMWWILVRLAFASIYSTFRYATIYVYTRYIRYILQRTRYAAVYYTLRTAAHPYTHYVCNVYFIYSIQPYSTTIQPAANISEYSKISCPQFHQSWTRFWRVNNAI